MTVHLSVAIHRRRIVDDVIQLEVARGAMVPVVTWLGWDHDGWGGTDAAFGHAASGDGHGGWGRAMGH